MAVFTEQQKRLTKKLITTLTEFTPGEENFKLCYRFCKSNFQFHRFLSVNDLQIRRTIDGLVEKFQIHSQPEKAQSLRELTNSFLVGNLEWSFCHSDAHYGTLSLLLCLSHSPLHSTFEPATPITPPPEEMDRFDWTSYLMEGIEYSPPHSSDSEWSESESGSVRGASDIEDSAVGEELSDDTAAHGDGLDSRSWLSEHVSFSYWESRNQTHELPEPSPSAHPSCYLAKKWEQHLLNTNPFQHPANSIFITESQIVRETIWLLLGAEQSFVYCIEKGEIRINKQVCVSHLTPLALSRVLESFAAVGSKLRQMRCFCRSIVEGRDDYVRCRTYEAFASGLQSCLQEVLAAIRDKELKIVENREMMSLLKLWQESHLTFNLVGDLYGVFQQAVLSVHQEQPRPSHLHPHQPQPRQTWQCATRLLDSLWAGLEHCDLMAGSGEDLLQLLSPLWIKTIRPYMEILDSWMTSGTINDTFKEFCIVRNQLETRALNYWEECFTVIPSATPTFLQPVMEHVIVAGKSLHLMESIGKLRHLQEGVAHSSPSKLSVAPINIYQEFLQSLAKFKTPHTVTDRSCDSPDRSCDIDSSDDEDVVKRKRGAKRSLQFSDKSTIIKEPREHHTPLTTPSKDHTSTRTISPHDHFDPLMKTYLDLLETSNRTTNTICLPDLKGVPEILNEKGLSVPLTFLICNSLSPLFHSRYHMASHSLVDLLRSEYNLTEHVRVIQQFFLMEAGPAIHYFTSDLFQRVVDDDDVWQNPSYLMAALEEAIHSTHSPLYIPYKHLEKSLSVSISSGNPSPSSLILHYSVPWPLDILFSEQTMTTYNQIFQLLLHLRWAKWNLEGVSTRTSVIRAMERGVAIKLHLLFLLKSKLLHFVNSLSSYLMTRVLHSVGAEFLQDVSMVTDLEGILSLHASYLHTIYDRCFLNPKASLVHKAIMTSLGLALQFRESWERGVAHFSVAKAEKLEEEFTKCCHFLISCLEKTVQRGSYPHLESLAFSLQPLKNAGRIFLTKKSWKK